MAVGEHTARDSSAGAGVSIEEVGESARLRADMSKTPFLSSSKTNLSRRTISSHGSVRCSISVSLRIEAKAGERA